MALRAGHADVRALQREFREGVVIESRGIPRARVMAVLAGCREASLRVRRIIGLVEIRHVATHAGGGRAGKLAAGVAGVAVQTRVGPG